MLEQYSKHSLHKMDQLVTMEKALERNRAEAKPKPSTPEPPRQRYRLSARYSPETLAEIVSRYAAGEPSTQLAKEYGIAKSSLSTLLAKTAPNPVVTGSFQRKKTRSANSDPKAWLFVLSRRPSVAATVRFRLFCPNVPKGTSKP
jgi:hypothetical protein